MMTVVRAFLECDLRMKVKQGGAVAQRPWSSDWTCQKECMKGNLGFRAPRVPALRASLYFFKCIGLWATEMGLRMTHPVTHTGQQRVF